MPVEGVGDAARLAVGMFNPYEEAAFITGAVMPDTVQAQSNTNQPYYTGSGFQSIDEHDAKVNMGILRNIWTNDD
jgi:hypothetical protein